MVLSYFAFFLNRYPQMAKSGQRRPHMLQPVQCSGSIAFGVVPLGQLQDMGRAELDAEAAALAALGVDDDRPEAFFLRLILWHG